jgi:hypothetical protein
VEEALQELGTGELAELGVQVPCDLVTDCVRLCCTLCLLEDDPSVIEPDVLSKDRARFEQTGDEKYVAKAHRRGKVGWNVGRRIEVAPHYRRPHLMLAWTGKGRSVPKIVPRRGSIVHRQVVEKVPSGFEGKGQKHGSPGRNRPCVSRPAKSNKASSTLNRVGRTSCATSALALGRRGPRFRVRAVGREADKPLRPRSVDFHRIADRLRELPLGGQQDGVRVASAKK